MRTERNERKKVEEEEESMPVVVHGDDFTFAARDSELRKMRSRMCEWYDVKVHGILGSGKREVREIEILRRNLR